jgi:DNA-binding XRE family transcriptional regulator
MSAKGRTDMDWKEAKKQLLKDQTIKREYERVDLAYEIGQMISEGRIAAKMTQSMLAQLVGTKQPSIARLEKGSYLPSLSFLQKIAEAFNTELLPPRLAMLEEKKKASNQFALKALIYYLKWGTKYMKATRSGNADEMKRLDKEFNPESLLEKQHEN